MARIPMPPGGLMKEKGGFFTDCMELKDPEGLTIEFFDNGYFEPSVLGLFNPDLPNQPANLYAAGTSIGPFYPQTKGSVVLVFFDADTEALYLDTLAIKDHCP